MDYDDEPPRKRRKAISKSLKRFLDGENSSETSLLKEQAEDEDVTKSDSRGSGYQIDRAGSSSREFVLDISKYIPVGCFRVERVNYGIDQDIWNSCQHWVSFHHPGAGPNDFSRGILNKTLQAMFFNDVLEPYHFLHAMECIRLEFRANNDLLGQIRVYFLPEDVARATMDQRSRDTRSLMQRLLADLDISPSTWHGSWSTSRDASLALRFDLGLDDKSGCEPSLFDMFNNLPSPRPDPTMVSDPLAKDAMQKLLDNDIPGLYATMHNYQRRSAAMMLQRETNPGHILDPRLTIQHDRNGAPWYYDITAGVFLRDPRTFEAVRGGICAETMGLGKTLICLGLILATRDLSSKIPVEYSVGSIAVRKTTGSLLQMAAARLGQSGTPWKNDLEAYEAEQGYTLDRVREALYDGAGYYFVPNIEPRRASRLPSPEKPPRKVWLCTTTIVVCPANLISQWRAEIDKHTNGLKVLYIRATSDKVPRGRELAQHDIIIFSKLRFEKEFQVSDGIQPSPMRDFHFKRLIIDEGHSFGNASGSSRTMAADALEAIQLSARWIISGTPTNGLYGAELVERKSGRTVKTSEDLPPRPGSRSQNTLENSSTAEAPPSPDGTGSNTPTTNDLATKQERRDLEKLGNIATTFLHARPWANPQNHPDHASWSQLVMQPRHGSKSHGTTGCLRATLEGMIIRHRPEDVLDDVKLPPLYHDIVYLDGSIQNKLSLNTFSMMIIVNAITSERKDQDYFFHARQRKSLLQLVANLRQASFFWSGFDIEHVQSTVKTARGFLDEKKVPITPEDETLLQQAIAMGEEVMANSICITTSEWHEMPMFIQNDFSDDVRSSWSLNGSAENPTLMGATMVVACQKFVESQLCKSDPAEGLLEAGQMAMKAVLPNSKATNSRRKSSKNEKRAKKAKTPSTPALAGGVTVGDATSPSKKVRVSPVAAVKAAGPAIHGASITHNHADGSKNDHEMKDASPVPKLKSAMKLSWDSDCITLLDPSSPLASTQIISTASSKLSYLMDKILQYQKSEKILVFYEADNIAYYIAQGLECLGVEHLIYAKSLSTAQRSDYVVKFNRSNEFRVLLMDVSQAAFGLDMSSASRVYFVNPVFSPQVEAQAVKRAHRIGQTKPVYVETLVLKGSIEEVILDRRENMSNEEVNKCKNIMDDQTMYDWIKNVQFQSVPMNEVSGPEQMAKLCQPQLMFGRSTRIMPKGHQGLEDSVVNTDPLNIERKRQSPRVAFSDKVDVIDGGRVGSNDSIASPNVNVADSEEQSQGRDDAYPREEIERIRLEETAFAIAERERRLQHPDHLLLLSEQDKSSASKQADEWALNGWDDSDEELDI